MAEPIQTVFDNAILDAQTLEKFINGDDNEDANPRLNTPYPTLQKAIKEMFESGGLPATPFKTHALMTASALVNGDYAQVTDGGADNGLYLKDGGAWVKSAYDPLQQAKDYTSTSLNVSEANQLVDIVCSRSFSGYTPEFLASGLSKNLSNNGGFVINTSASVIYTPKNLIVIDRKGVRYSPVAQNVNWGTTEYLTNYNMYLYLNTATNLFSLASNLSLPSDTEKQTLLLCAIIHRNNTSVSVTTKAPYSIDYGLQGAKTVYDKASIFAAGTGVNTLPNYDTTAHTLTLPAGTLVKYRDVVYTVPSGGLTINCSNPSELSAAVSIYWNLATDTFVVKKYNAALSMTDAYRLVLVATVRDTGITGTYIGNWRDYVSVDLDSEFTINNGSPFPVVIPPPPAAVETRPSAYVFSATTSGNVGRGNLPNYDTATTTFQFPRDTIFNYGNSRYVVPVGGLSVPCNNPDSLSSAVVLYWDTATNELHIRKYNAKAKDILSTFVRVAAIRDSAIVSPQVTPWQERVGIDTTMPYTINGIHPYATGSSDSKGLSSISVQDQPQVRACAHTGFNGNYLAPQNTLPAFKLAADYGFWGAETDLRITSDGHWVIMHDATIDATTTGTGAVADLTLEQIRAFDANDGNPEFVGVKVPTVEEYLTTCKRHNLVPYMQTYASPVGAAGESLANSIREIVGEDGAVIISFDTADLYAIREFLPNIAVEYLASVITPANIAIAKALGNCSLGIKAVGISKAGIALAAQDGIRVSMWTDNKNFEDYIDMNLLRISTDYAIPPDFNKGFQKALVKNKADWSNFDKSAGFTGSVANSTITIPATESVSINLGKIPLNVLIVEFYATSTGIDSDVNIYAGKEIKTGLVNTLSPTHKFSCLIRNSADVDTVLTFRANTSELTVRDVKIKVYEV